MSEYKLTYNTDDILKQTIESFLDIDQKTLADEIIKEMDLELIKRKWQSLKLISNFEDLSDEERKWLDFSMSLEPFTSDDVIKPINKKEVI